jgi:glutaredoxin 3
MSEKFYVYSKNNCGFCDRLTEFMDSKELQYEKFTLDQDFTREEFIDKFGYNSTFPQVLLNNKNLGGMKDTVRYMVENNFV